ncbi:hypothetical protein [Brunnivagina elsteri]|uniref:Uncharacterized protein n=1 Tax=Brunnivagina elsteri CCALA 953 TaxID=987040 RepID=A0A2A2TGL2_9CYAN|nr:hypothetical protein [Calothrix elsteri]PAX52768.1 hypothetical protein CK510_17510 [Calothrix elsteri CCALA 953]
MEQEKLSPELYELFSTYLKQSVTEDSLLPSFFTFNNIYSIWLKASYGDYRIQFVISPPPNSYLDYYIPYGEYGAHTRSSFHGRIMATGERISLENYQGEWGHNIYPDDPDRTIRDREAMVIHNQQVTAILKAKGFVV